MNQFLFLLVAQSARLLVWLTYLVSNGASVVLDKMPRKCKVRGTIPFALIGITSVINKNSVLM